MTELPSKVVTELSSMVVTELSSKVVTELSSKEVTELSSKVVAVMTTVTTIGSIFPSGWSETCKVALFFSLTAFLWGEIFGNSSKRQYFKMKETINLESNLCPLKGFLSRFVQQGFGGDIW